jgi:hypothetical protein
MNRKLKTLTLSFVAACGIGAVLAPAALGANELFRAAAEPWTVDGSALNNQAFETTADVFECAGVSLSGPEIKTKTPSEIRVVPNYTGCEAVGGGVPARVTMTTCGYVLTSSIPIGKTQATLHIDCTKPSDEIDIEFEEEGTGIWRSCIMIPPGTPGGGGTTYANNGNHVDVTLSLTNVTYTEAGFCGGAKPATGVIKGQITMKAKDHKGNATKLEWK